MRKRTLNFRVKCAWIDPMVDDALSMAGTMMMMPPPSLSSSSLCGSSMKECSGEHGVYCYDDAVACSVQRHCR